MFASILKDMKDVIPDLKSDSQKIRLKAWHEIQARCIAEYLRDFCKHFDRKRAQEEHLKNIRKMADFYPLSRTADKDHAHVP